MRCGYYEIAFEDLSELEYRMKSRLSHIQRLSSYDDVNNYNNSLININDIKCKSLKNLINSEKRIQKIECLLEKLKDNDVIA